MSLLSVLQSANEEIVVEEGGVLPKGVGRSAPRTSGKVVISYQLVNGVRLVEVPAGKRVRDAVRPSDHSHVIEVRTTAAARRLTRKGARRVIRAATVVIYRTSASCRPSLTL